jgi:hypothetical protein
MKISKLVKQDEVNGVMMDLFDRERAGEDITREKSVEAFKLGKQGWREPEPLVIEAGGALSYPLEALPPILRDAIRDLKKIVQAPVELIAASVKASANLATQAHVDVVTPDGRVSPTSLFFITEGSSGERKSTVDSYAMAAHHEFDDEIRRKALEDRHRLEASAVIWDRKKGEFGKRPKKSRDPESKVTREEELEAFLKEVGPKPPAWQGAPVRIVRDPTLEGLEKHLSISPTAGLFCDEAAVFLGGFSMSPENRDRTMAGFSSLWDGKGVNRARSSDGMNSHPGKRVCMHLMVQDVIFNKFIAGNEVMKGQGFGPRCLLTRAVSTKGSRVFVRENPRETPGMVNFLNRVREILQLALPLKEGGSCRLQPRSLALSPAAEELYIEFYNDVESRQGPDGDLAEISGTASKMPEQALRLAATFQFFADIHSDTISEESLEAGIRSARYYLNEALRVDQDGGREYRLDCAAKVLEYIRKSELDTFTLTRIRQFGPACARKSANVTRELLNILVRHGYLKTQRDEKTNHVTYLAHPRLWTR